MKCYASDIIKLALSEVGYKVKAGKDNKYARWIDENYPDFYNTRKNGADWCDIFVDYLFIKSFGFDNALRLLNQPMKSCGAGCSFSIIYYKRMGSFSKTPTPGSQVFFSDSMGNPVHTGIVTGVENGKIHTVEGNTSNGVNSKEYYIDAKNIIGYGFPKYDTPSKKTIEEVANEVLAGKWGGGAERRIKLTAAGYDYDEVQAKVNMILYEEKHKKEAYHLTLEKDKYSEIIIKVI